TVSGAMRDVLIALLPVAIVSIILYKLNAVFLIAVCLAVAALTELLFRKLLKKEPSLNDGSAMVTGLLVALCFGPGTSWWTAALATFIGVGVAKELMGGLGWNRYNPALLGRVSVILILPLFQYVTASFAPLKPYLGSIDTLTQATPLALLAQGEGMPSLIRVIFGHPGGALGETTAFLVILGGLYLVRKGHISWHIPISIVATVFVIGLVTIPTLGWQGPLYHVLTGGVLLGAFFMATDWVTSPITDKGKIIFGIGIGVLVMVFRLWLAPTEGTAFSILIMNAFVPVIDRYTKRLKFGEVKESAATVVPAKPVEKST
ncbi:MAG: RnfABCDGE type electron transport complex subunit D, partial [Dethiobacteria bacterium]